MPDRLHGLIPLATPENDWGDRSRRSLDLTAAVESRLGSVPGTIEVLPGGHGNLNLRIGHEAVLRIYERNNRAAAVEWRLLDLGWESFRVPEVLERGSDFLLLEWLELHPILDRLAHGRMVGAGAAEIHRYRFDASGTLDADLTVEDAHPDPAAYVTARLDELGDSWEDLRKPVLGALNAIEQRGPSHDPTLNHGDFKPPNLFRDVRGRLVVLDWEFAFSGPRLMDVGQLFRWGTSDRFRKGFVHGYRAGGGDLPDDWRERAEILDLVHLLSLVSAHGDEPRNSHVRARIERTLASTRW